MAKRLGTSYVLTRKELLQVALDVESYIKSLQLGRQLCSGPKAGLVVDPEILAEMERFRKLQAMLRSLAVAKEATLPPRIQTGIKIPPLNYANLTPRADAATGWAQLLRQMKRGDSILVPAAVMGAIIVSAYRINIQTTRRLIGPNVRIWRTN